MQIVKIVINIKYIKRMDRNKHKVCQLTIQAKIRIKL